MFERLHAENKITSRQTNNLVSLQLGKRLDRCAVGLEYLLVRAQDGFAAQQVN